MKLNKWIICSALCASFLYAAPTKVELDNMTKIVGYFPNWGVYGGHRNFFVKDVRFDKLTHVNVAFAAVDNSTNAPKSPDEWADLQNTYGELWGSEYAGNYGQLKKFKKQYPHISVLISIGGWTLSSKFHDIAADATKRKEFATNAVKYMKQYGFDGIDIDWEFPTSKREADKVDIQSDEGNPYATAADKVNFTFFMKDLREAIDAQAAIDNKYYQLTTAIGSSEALIEGTNPGDYSKYVDFINIMSYDMHGAWEDRTNHQSPIYANPNLPKDKITLEHAVDTLIAKGVPSKKLVGGSPFYSRGWKNVECAKTATVTYIDSSYATKTKKVTNKVVLNKNGTNLTGLNCYAGGGAAGLWDGGRPAGVNSWYDIVKTLESDPSFVKYRDNYAQVPYLYSSSKKEFYTYEDELSVEARAQFVKDKKMGGIIFWELSSDTRTDKGDADKSLLTAMYNKLYDKGQSVKDTVVSTPPVEDVKVKTLKETEGEEVTSKKQEGELPTTNTIPDYSITHYPPNESYGPHYTTGEQVIDRDAGKTYQCSAKWWVNAKPVINNVMDQAWDCKEISSATVPVKIPDDEKKVIKEKADTVAEILKTNPDLPPGEVKEIVDLTSTNSTTGSATDPLPSSTTVDETPLTPQQIKAAEEEMAKCRVSKVYNNGDVCTTDGAKWYKFKWYTLYNGKIETSMVETTAANKPQLNIVAAANLKDWSNSVVYSKGGMQVVFEGYVFESKYWNSGNKPEKFNDNTPWKYIGIADRSQSGRLPAPSVGAKEIIDGTTKADAKDPIIVADDKDATTSTYDKTNEEPMVTKGIDSKGEQEKIDENLKRNTGSTVAGKLVFRPFIDAASWPPYNPDESGALAAGIKHYAFSFINSNGSTCSPRWGGYDAYTMDNNTLNIPNKITAITKAGGTSMVSFGGAVAGEQELPQVCKTADDLTKAYKEVVDKLGVKLLDYDIEGENSYKKENVLKRMKAIAQLQKTPNYEDVKISFTLAVMPTGLLSDTGIMIINTALQEGVKINMVNLMLMDYGPAFPADIRDVNQMAAYSIMAIDSLNVQLKELLNDTAYPKVNGNYYHLIGAIPMIGRNDTLNEWFYPEDIVKLTTYAKTKGLGMLSMWSLNRDTFLSSGEPSDSQLYTSTKLSETDYKKAFGNSSKFGYSKELLKGE